MKYKAMISDIDGTLGPVAQMPLPSVTVRDAISAATKKGFIFTLATGKPFSLVEYLIDYLHLSSPVIVDNGAALYDSVTKKELIEYVIEYEEASKILTHIQRFTKEYRVSCKNENFKNIVQLKKGQTVRKFVILDLKPDQADNLLSNLELQFKNLHLVKSSSDLGSEYNSVYISSAQATK